ncbi:RloB family protein [Methylobacterium sp. NPDC080182]|uniref:RloB family protein n=1 Tax=Methylobacterium sp. NPDC080182 TaxID=3390590 RepID=UPI003D025E95
MSRPAKARVVPPKLSRRRAMLRPKFRIVAVCEGRNTEPQYLAEFCRDHGNGLVQIRTVGGVGVPQTVVAEASKILQEMRRSKSDSFERFDQCWAIFDHDNHPHVEQHVRNARAGGLMVAFSNPCIELWGVLHFGEYGRPARGHVVQDALKVLMPSYDPHGSKLFDYELMRLGYREAVKRAKRLVKEAEKLGAPLGNPHTNFYELTEIIRINGISIKARTDDI